MPCENSLIDTFNWWRSWETYKDLTILIILLAKIKIYNQVDFEMLSNNSNYWSKSLC